MLAGTADQLVHPTHRGFLDLGLVENRSYGLLGGAPGLEETDKAAGLAQLGDLKIYVAGIQGV